MKLKFTELQDAANQFIQLMNDHDGELTPENETLMNLMNDKIDTGFFIVDRVTQEINDINSMIKELNARKKQKQQQLDFISAVVINSCDALDIKKHETFKVFTIANKPGAVDVVDETLIPDEFKKTTFKINVEKKDSNKVEFMLQGVVDDEQKSSVESVDKKTILKLLKDNAVVPGCQLKTGKRIAIRRPRKTNEDE